MRSLGRLIAASLFGGCLFVGCVASPQTGRLAERAPVRVDTIAKQHAPDLPVDAAVAAPTTVAAAPATAPPRPRVAAASRPARTPRAASSAGPAARAVTPPAAPSWERMQSEVGGGPYLVARAAYDGLPVSVNPGDEPATYLSNPTPNGSPRVVLVVAEQGDWLKVLLPIRPNSSLGWIKRGDVNVSMNAYRVVVAQDAHRINVFENGSLIVDEPVAVGKGSTPTPTGQFFVTDLMATGNPGGAYGPYAFGLSGYSEVYQKFGKGDGVVGIHGTNDRSSVGRDASHGCIRVQNEVIEHLASFLPLGTPVAIRP